MTLVAGKTMSEADFEDLLRGAFVEVEDTRPHRWLSETAFRFYRDHSPVPMKAWPFQPMVTTDTIWRRAFLSGWWQRMTSWLR